MVLKLYQRTINDAPVPEVVGRVQPAVNRLNFGNQKTKKIYSNLLRKKLTNMTDENKPLKIEFAPGCFDHFEGTQEELDELIAEITQAVTSGEIMEMSNELTDEDFAELPEEVQLQLLQSLTVDDDEGEIINTKRRLQ
jgi:hypothetical protein